ncbi:putative glycosyl, partial [Golovinomyces cichoracearum]
MLKDAALQHYNATFNSENLPDLSTLYQTIKLNFEGKEYQQSMLVKWNEISLKTTLQDIESTDVEVALNSLITKSSQHPNELELRISKAQQNPMGKQFFQDDENEAVVHFTDRRYHKNNANRPRQNYQITSNLNERNQRNDRQ